MIARYRTDVHQATGVFTADELGCVPPTPPLCPVRTPVSQHFTRIETGQWPCMVVTSLEDTDQYRRRDRGSMPLDGWSRNIMLCWPSMLIAKLSCNTKSYVYWTCWKQPRLVYSGVFGKRTWPPLLIIIKVFVKRKILSIDTIVSVYTRARVHTHTFTEAPAHTSILTIQS